MEPLTTAGITNMDVLGYHRILSTPSTPVISNLPVTAYSGGKFTATVSTNGDGATSVTTSTPTVCKVAGFVVSFVNVGTCTLTAHVAAGANHSAANGSPQSFAVHARERSPRC